MPALYKPPYTLDSTSRYSYQIPAAKSELSESLTRFGCNKHKYKPAVGAGRGPGKTLDYLVICNFISRRLAERKQYKGAHAKQS